MKTYTKHNIEHDHKLLTDDGILNYQETRVYCTLEWPRTCCLSFPFLDPSLLYISYSILNFQILRKRKKKHVIMSSGPSSCSQSERKNSRWPRSSLLEIGRKKQNTRRAKVSKKGIMSSGKTSSGGGRKAFNSIIQFSVSDVFCLWSLGFLHLNRLFLHKKSPETPKASS